MIQTFEEALKHVLTHEGGYVNHPRDPGGRTNLGVTQRTWEEWVKRSVDEVEMKALTQEDVAPLYKARYWDVIKANQLPFGVDYAVFDFAVNAGVRQSAVTLQRVVRTELDGIIGPKTLQVVSQLNPEDVIKMFSDERVNFYKKLNTFDTFGKGWLRRTAEVRKTALGILYGKTG